MLMLGMLTCFMVTSQRTADFTGVESTPNTPEAGRWYVSPNGYDGNNCANPAFPCASIDAAMEKASEGDATYMKIGIYKGAENSFGTNFCDVIPHISSTEVPVALEARVIV